MKGGKGMEISKVFFFSRNCEIRKFVDMICHVCSVIVSPWPVSSLAQLSRRALCRCLVKQVPGKLMDHEVVSWYLPKKQIYTYNMHCIYKPVDWIIIQGAYATLRVPTTLFGKCWEMKTWYESICKWKWFNIYIYDIFNVLIYKIYSIIYMIYSDIIYIF